MVEGVGGRERGRDGGDCLNESLYMRICVQSEDMVVSTGWIRMDGMRLIEAG